VKDRLPSRADCLLPGRWWHRKPRMPRYPVGKLSHEQLARLLARLGPSRPRDVLLGPAVGEDAAAVAVGDRALVVATDPVTFAAHRAGWYAVQINANDVATMGARPRWFQACVLMPTVSPVTVRSVFDDVGSACNELGVIVLGGHTEITTVLDHPIVIGTMMGLVERGSLVRSAGARIGDAIMLTKGAAIEATSIMARECGDRLAGTVGRRALSRAAGFLFDPGISVVREAMLAARAGATAMHDPTEGGVLTGLWEMAQAAGRRFVVDVETIPVEPLTEALCRELDIDPLRAIASGCLLITIPAGKAGALRRRLRRAGIAATVVGEVRRGRAGLFDAAGKRVPVTAIDEITKLFE